MLTTLLLTLALAGDSFPSGPAVGEKLGEFKAHAFSGGDAGKEFKFLEKTKGGPTLLIFMHPPENGITRPGLQFLRPVDKYAAGADKLSTHIVWVTGDKEKIDGFLKRAEQSLNLQSPVSICLEGGKDGPAAYGLNDKVSITVLVARESKVVANFAMVDPNAKDAAKVIAAVAKVLGKDPPKEEKKEEKKKADGRAPELQQLMRKMIQKDLDEAGAKKIADDMRAWAGKDEKKLIELRDYARVIVRAAYGTEHAQAQLKKLAE